MGSKGWMKPQGREGQGMSRKQCKNCVWLEAKHEYGRSQSSDLESKRKTRWTRTLKFKLSLGFILLAVKIWGCKGWCNQGGFPTRLTQSNWKLQKLQGSVWSEGYCTMSGESAGYQRNGNRRGEIKPVAMDKSRGLINCFPIEDVRDNSSVWDLQY